MKEAKRDYILEQARKAYIANPMITFQEIAQAAGVGRATMYRHFESREALLEALAMRSLDAVDKAATKALSRASSAYETMVFIIEEILALGNEYYFTALASSFLGNPKVAARYKAQVDALKLLVDSMKAEGSIGKNIPTGWVIHAIDALIYAGWSSVDSGDVARNDAVTHVVDTLFKGVGGNNDK